MGVVMTREAAQALVDKHGSIGAAARALGVPRSTLRDRVYAARSTLYREPQSDGTVVLEWVKTEAVKGQQEDRDELIAALKAEFNGYQFPATLGQPTATEADLATVYLIADHHLMMLAWAAETGNNYDMKIAERLLLETAGRLIAKTPASAEALILNLGDFFHADDNSARTPEHQNQLDTDGRYAKALQMGVKLHIRLVELALQKHEHVTLRVLPGNHDPYAALALSIALGAFFSNQPRVTVDTDPSLFFHWSFGVNFVVGHHGHTVPPEKIAGVMAAYWPKEWGNSTHRYAYLGHIHRKTKGGKSADEANGVIWETFNTIAAKDAYAYGKGYSSERSMTAITLHKLYGEDSRVVEHVREG